MVNTDYRLEAIGLLLREDCILQAYAPLIPYKSMLVQRLGEMGCVRKSDVQKRTDVELMQAGLPDAAMAALFRKFLTLYDPRPQKMKEAAQAAPSPQQAAMMQELYLLPGVKSTRANLYIRAGLTSLEAVAQASPEEIIQACRRAIEQDKLAAKAPLMKEARTHIAVARAFTDDKGG